MKKLIVLAIMLFASVAIAQTWHTANQVTFSWDAVAPILPTDTIKYAVYVKKDVDITFSPRQQTQQAEPTPKPPVPGDSLPGAQP